MEKKTLIDMVNKDMAEEHAAIIRYLVHGWLEGEDTPLGSSLISISREEMWHMHWLGMIIGELGGEPNFTPAVYPYDPTSRETILKSYIKYEENLVPHYNGEAQRVDDPHIKRVLQREAWESAIHARKFTRKLGKLSPEEQKGLAGQESALPRKLLNTLQDAVTGKYNEMLQHMRTSWLFQGKDAMGWKIMDQAMEKMRQLAHLAEPIAEDGVPPEFKQGTIGKEDTPQKALKKAIDDVTAAWKRHDSMRKESEVQKYAGLLINLDLTLQQEEYQRTELQDWIRVQKR